jgi:hypothetical protein
VALGELLTGMKAPRAPNVEEFTDSGRLAHANWMRDASRISGTVSEPATASTIANNTLANSTGQRPIKSCTWCLLMEESLRRCVRGL